MRLFMLFLLMVLGPAVQAQSTDLLPADRAFELRQEFKNDRVVFHWTIARDYYLYADRIKATDGTPGAQPYEITLDRAPESHTEPTGEEWVFRGPLTAELRYTQMPPQPITLSVQGCHETDPQICYPPHRVTVIPPARTMEAQTAPPSTPLAASPTPASPVKSVGMGLAAALLAALLGGLILNFMPCVLPVLSLKVMALAHSGESPQQARQHALWYAAGVLTSFLVIGGLVFLLRSSGHALGWGFQLQQPLFVAVLVYVMLALGLNLSGVYQFGSSLSGMGDRWARRPGPAGDFFTGVLACLAASPCTAPFMGSALAYALASSPWAALSVFLALGMGMAAPFLVIGFVPALAQRLPKPGAWMNTLKQFLAFPLYLTATWLLWVLGQQLGPDPMALVLAGAVWLAMGLWWAGRPGDRRLGHVVTASLLFLAMMPLLQISQTGTERRPVDDTPSRSVAYSAQTLEALRAEGKTVFLNMTADWCATCKVNEKTVLSTDAFEQQMTQSKAVYMKGDWTSSDPAITAFLDEHQAVGVPFYMVFHGQQDSGQALPTLLTSARVAQALKTCTLPSSTPSATTC